MAPSPLGQRSSEEQLPQSQPQSLNSQASPPHVYSRSAPHPAHVFLSIITASQVMDLSSFFLSFYPICLFITLLSVSPLTVNFEQLQFELVNLKKEEEVGFLIPSLQVLRIQGLNTTQGLIFSREHSQRKIKSIHNMLPKESYYHHSDPISYYRWGADLRKRTRPSRSYRQSNHNLYEEPVEMRRPCMS